MRSLLSLALIACAALPAHAQLVNVQIGGGYRQRIVQPFVPVQQIAVPVQYAQPPVVIQQQAAPACATGTCAQQIQAIPQTTYAVPQQAPQPVQVFADPVYQQPVTVLRQAANYYAATNPLLALGTVAYGLHGQIARQRDVIVRQRGLRAPVVVANAPVVVQPAVVVERQRSLVELNIGRRRR